MHGLEATNQLDTNIEDCEVCNNCGRILTIEDEYYSGQDDDALCDACSCYCESCDEYHKLEQGNYIDNIFVCNNCNKII